MATELWSPAVPGHKWASQAVAAQGLWQCRLREEVNLAWADQVVDRALAMATGLAADSRGKVAAQEKMVLAWDQTPMRGLEFLHTLAPVVRVMGPMDRRRCIGPITRTTGARV